MNIILVFPQCSTNNIDESACLSISLSAIVELETLCVKGAIVSHKDLPFQGNQQFRGLMFDLLLHNLFRPPIGFTYQLLSAKGSLKLLNLT